MVKYYTKQNDGRLFKVNFEDEVFDTVDCNSNIDYTYRIPEDGVLSITKDDDTKEVLEVKKNDLLLKMYSADSNYRNREFIVLHNDKLADYFERKDAFYKSEKACKSCDDCNCMKVGESC